MHLFFYGTLTHERANPIARAVLPLLRPVGRASVAGRLFAVGTAAGWYPALVAGPGRVTGWVYRTGAGFDPAALARLDAYEDYAPARPRSSEYLRRRLPVRLARGGRVLAQAYLWNRAVRPGMVAIPGGNFAAWLREPVRSGSLRLAFAEESD